MLFSHQFIDSTFPIDQNYLHILFPAWGKQNGFCTHGLPWSTKFVKKNPVICTIFISTSRVLKETWNWLVCCLEAFGVALPEKSEVASAAEAFSVLMISSHSPCPTGNFAEEEPFIFRPCTAFVTHKSVIDPLGRSVLGYPSFTLKLALLMV